MKSKTKHRLYKIVGVRYNSNKKYIGHSMLFKNLRVIEQFFVFNMNKYTKPMGIILFDTNIWFKEFNDVFVVIDKCGEIYPKLK